MREIKGLLLGFVVALALSLVLATAASAEEYKLSNPPEIGRCVEVTPGTGGFSGTRPHCVKESKTHTGNYEWLPGPGAKPKFVAHFKAPKFQTVGGQKINCTVMFLTGEYTGPKTEAVSHITLEGCLWITSSFQKSCQTQGLEPGSIEEEVLLEGDLAYIKKPPMPRVGWDLKPQAGPTIVNFQCGGTLVFTVASLEGSVIGRVKPLNRMVERPKVIYKQTEGKQIPEMFEGGVKDTLTFKTVTPELPPVESSEQIGLQSEDLREDEEPLEVKGR